MKRSSTSGNPLSILLVVIPMILLMIAAFHYGPIFLSRFQKPYRVGFASPEGFWVQNLSTNAWSGGELIINGQHTLRFGRVKGGAMLRVKYEQFTNGLSQGHVRELELKPDGVPPAVYKP